MLALLLTIGLLGGCGAADSSPKLSGTDDTTEETQGSGTVQTADTQEETTGTVEIASGLSGVSRISAEEEYGDDWGMLLYVRDITPTSMTLVCARFDMGDGEPIKGLNTGSYYVLEQETNGTWTALDLLSQEGDTGWEDIGYLITDMPGEETTWSVDWEQLYGALPAGSYRIGKEINRDGEKRMVYAAFDLTEDSEVSALTNSGTLGVSRLSGWDYRIVEAAEGSEGSAICFRPQGENGWIRLREYSQFGVCGTGLAEETITLENGMKALMGTYDEGSSDEKGSWDFISFLEPYKHYAAWMDTDANWYPRYEDAVMQILNSMQVQNE